MNEITNDDMSVTQILKIIVDGSTNPTNLNETASQTNTIEQLDSTEQTELTELTNAHKQPDSIDTHSQQSCLIQSESSDLTNTDKHTYHIQSEPNLYKPKNIKFSHSTNKFSKNNNEVLLTNDNIMNVSQSNISNIVTLGYLSTSKKIIRKLCLAGGGYFGIAQIPVLEKLFTDYQNNLELKEICCVSVGSLIGGLIAVGYTPSELSTIFMELDFNALIKDNMFPYLKLYEKFGMYEAIKLENTIENLIREKTNIKFCTFSQIPINLVIIATNLNYQTYRKFSKDTSPNLAISKAIRMSISYPPIITPVLYDGDYYGDGGESSNYPITLYSDSELNDAIGITFASFNENIDGTLNQRTNISDVYDYVRSVCHTMNRSTYISQLKEKHIQRSIIIKIDKPIHSMNLDITLSEKKIIYECGVRAAEQIKQIIYC